MSNSTQVTEKELNDFVKKLEEDQFLFLGIEKITRPYCYAEIMKKSMLLWNNWEPDRFFFEDLAIFRLMWSAKEKATTFKEDNFVNNLERTFDQWLALRKDKHGLLFASNPVVGSFALQDTSLRKASGEVQNQFVDAYELSTQAQDLEKVRLSI